MTELTFEPAEKKGYLSQSISATSLVAHFNFDTTDTKYVNFVTVQTTINESDGWASLQPVEAADIFELPIRNIPEGQFIRFYVDNLPLKAYYI